jgi:hypothetical protein
MSTTHHSTTTLSSIAYEHRSITSRATTPDSLFSDIYIPANQTHNTTFNYYNATEPAPIFPSNTNHIRTFTIPLTQASDLSDHWPIGFRDIIEWTHIWNGQEHRLDQFLRYARTEDNSRIPWTYEHMFKGAWFRITIDHRKSLTGMPILTHGDIISIQNWNCHQSRYIVDHCILKDDVNAYLKVYGFTADRQIYDIASLRPPLILVVPLEYCNTRVHPNSTTQLNFLSTCKMQIKSLFKQLKAKWRKIL